MMKNIISLISSFAFPNLFFSITLTLALISSSSIFSCGGKAKNNDGVQQGEGRNFTPLYVVDFAPSGRVIFSRPEIFAKFNLPVTDFSISTTPYIKGEVYYFPQDFKISFFPFEDLSLNTEYTVKVEAKDVFSGMITQFSWKFSTPNAFPPPELGREDEIRAPGCFKDNLKIFIRFSEPVTFEVYVNSYKFLEGIYRGFPFEIEVDRFLRDGENEIEVVSVSTDISGEYVKKTFSLVATRDNIPPSVPSLLPISRTLFMVSSKDNCSDDESIIFLLYWSPDKSSNNLKELGAEVGKVIDTTQIAFDGGFICVKAVDSAGNVSECSEMKEQGFFSEEITLNLPCDKPFFSSDFVACQGEGGKISLFSNPLTDYYSKSLSFPSVGEIEGSLFDVCGKTGVLLTDKGLLLTAGQEEGKISVTKRIDVMGKFVSCSGGQNSPIFVSDGENIYLLESGNLSKFSKKGIRYMRTPLINDEAKISGIFANSASLFVLVSDFTPAYFISMASGKNYDELKKILPPSNLAVISLPINSITSAVYLKVYYRSFRKILFFSDVLILLGDEGAFADFFPYTSGKGEYLISPDVSDMYIITTDNKINLKERIIFLYKISGMVKIVDERSYPDQR